MDHSILVTTMLVLVPLLPSMVIYLVLTPKKSERSGKRQTTSEDQAEGKYSRDLPFGGNVSFKFKVFGSSATYVILLFSSFFIHADLQNNKVLELGIQRDIMTDKNKAEARRLVLEMGVRRLSLMDHQAWRVEIPIRFENITDSDLQEGFGGLKQTRVELLPTLETPHSNRIKLWVVRQDEGFPAVRLTVPGAGMPRVIDLNDATAIDYDHSSRKMKGIAPVWFAAETDYRDY
jgi:hypothetical protein